MDELDDLADAMETLEGAIDQGPEPITRSDIDVPKPQDLAVVGYTAPWDRQITDNPDHKWLMFEHYRDSGIGRTIIATMRWYNESGGTISKPTTTETSIYRYSSENDWTERALAYDQEQERLYQLARSEATRDMVQRHGDQIETALDGLMAPINALNARIENDPEFMEQLSKTSAAKLIGLANSAARTMPALMSAERLARDMPTEIVGGQVEHKVEIVERNQIANVLEVLDRVGVLNGRAGDSDAGEVVDAEVVEVHPLPAEGDGQL